MPRVVITIANQDDTYTLAQRAALELLTQPVSTGESLHFRRASGASVEPNVELVFTIDFVASGASGADASPVLHLAADTGDVPQIAREFPSIRPSGYGDDGTEIFALHSDRTGSDYPPHALIYD